MGFSNRGSSVESIKLNIRWLSSLYKKAWEIKNAGIDCIIYGFIFPPLVFSA